MLVSLFSLSLSWYAEYKKLMNFEVFPKPFPMSFATSEMVCDIVVCNEKKNFAIN